MIKSKKWNKQTYLSQDANFKILLFLLKTLR